MTQLVKKGCQWRIVKFKKKIPVRLISWLSINMIQSKLPWKESGFKINKILQWK